MQLMDSGTVPDFLAETYISPSGVPESLWGIKLGEIK
jgi:hypothetical protein